MRLVKGSQGKLVYGPLEFDCALGKAGVTEEKREGDHATPVGRYLLRWLFYRADKISNIQSLLPQQKISTVDGWCDAPDHEHYNRYVRLPFEHSHEKLWRDDDLYDLVIVLGHNDSPAVPGAGSCIFIHVAQDQYGPTEGCVALKKTDLVELLAELDPECWIEIAPAD
ncbi:L,D-transpeptidase family protein [Sneathiella marina]|uniref:L,D-transpeptidase family protein n=1 Tax=Sneathiella marina TaxID=2950108 RepID=A0ABY4W2L9_9PROT|nr:L,D-transpeptidase family protein [Sneathiella marina]USG61437.1 L,D-transpeptidase family protein [Sneathiella marina]